MSKSRKFKNIKDHTGFKTGKTYIRAVVNCHGTFWLEIFTVTKKPTLLDIKHMGKNWMFDIKPVHRVYSKLRNKLDTGRFVSSFIDQPNLCATNYTTGVVTEVESGSSFPFSNKVLNYLESNMGNVKQFLQAINPNVTITDEVMAPIQEYFDFMIHVDEESHKKYMEA